MLIKGLNNVRKTRESEFFYLKFSFFAKGQTSPLDVCQYGFGIRLPFPDNFSYFLISLPRIARVYRISICYLFLFFQAVKRNSDRFYYECGKGTILSLYRFFDTLNNIVWKTNAFICCRRNGTSKGTKNMIDTTAKLNKTIFVKMI